MLSGNVSRKSRANISCHGLLKRHSHPTWESHFSSRGLIDFQPFPFFVTATTKCQSLILNSNFLCVDIGKMSFHITPFLRRPHKFGNSCSLNARPENTITLTSAGTIFVCYLPRAILVKMFQVDLNRLITTALCTLLLCWVWTLRTTSLWRIRCHKASSGGGREQLHSLPRDSSVHHSVSPLSKCHTWSDFPHVLTWIQTLINKRIHIFKFRWDAII